MKFKLLIVVLIIGLFYCMTGNVYAEITDIEDHWAFEAIERWITQGLVSSYSDSTYKPDVAISRIEFITLINQTFNFEASKEVNFFDVMNDWHSHEVGKAIAAGYILGYEDGTFRPDNKVTRQEAALMITRIIYLKNSGGEETNYELADAHAIPEWSRKAINNVVNEGIMFGYPDGTFKPNQAITRAEALITLDRVLNMSMTNTTYHKAGIYGPQNGVKFLNTNVEINSDGVTLQNLVIGGDLQLNESIGRRNVILENVTVKGEIIIRGGSSVTLYGNFNRVNVEAENIHLELADGEVKELTLNGKTEVTGKGKIVKANINADKSIILQKPKNIWVAKNITATVGGKIIGAIIPSDYNNSTSRKPEINEKAESDSAADFSFYTPDCLLAGTEDISGFNITVKNVKHIKDDMNLRYMIKILKDSSSLDDKEVSYKCSEAGTFKIAYNKAYFGPPTGFSIAQFPDIKGETGINIPLTIKGGIDAGYYKFTLSLVDIEGKIIASSEEFEFIVVDIKDVKIVGNTEIGDTLSVTGIFPTNVPVNYQWKRNDFDIVGATDSTYDLTDADVGRHISVEIDYRGTTITSEPTELITKGDGTVDNPYAVATKEQLDGFVRNNPNLHYIQIEDIDLSKYNNWEPIPAFSGVFDGSGFTISNLTINKMENNFVGLFSELVNNGKLKNINLKYASVKGYNYVGALVGKASGLIDNCYSEVNIVGSMGVGGLIGYSEGNIVNCLSIGNVTGTGSSYIGGLVGRLNSGSIEKSFSIGLTSTLGNGNFAGGLVGHNKNGDIINCYSMGDVIAGSYMHVGGLVGTNTGLINKCYSVGLIDYDSSGGGLVGSNAGEITNSYYNYELSGQSDLDKGEPRSTNQMVKGNCDSEIDGQYIYSTWDDAIWDFRDETEYPILRGFQSR
jgi:hypothetical protein